MPVTRFMRAAPTNANIGLFTYCDGVTFPSLPAGAEHFIYVRAEAWVAGAGAGAGRGGGRVE